MTQNKLVSWIMGYIDDWKDHRDANYLEQWKEYERLWRGEWHSEDRLRDSERSRIISPSLQQAIENHTAEIEEAVFGSGGSLFSIEDDLMDQNKQDIEVIQAYMKECFKKNGLRKAVGDVTLLASIYGTGIGEVSLKKVEELVPAQQGMPDVNARAIGVVKKDKISVELKPVNPQNFLIDPTATSIKDALGVAIEEFVSTHKVAENMTSGVYFAEDLGQASVPDNDIEASWIDEEYHNDKVNIIRYYGLVPEALLESLGKEEPVEDLFKNEEEAPKILEDYGNLVEAIIVIGNGTTLLKAEKSPYMMQDRPVVAYQDDTVPNRFWGRGVAEKGFNMQKAIDAQLRSHLDSLALTTVPMMGMDATRLPRGSRLEIRPGKSVLTNGNPAEILMPFKFGNTDPSNIQTAQTFENMLLQATGTLDTANMQKQPTGGELSVTLSGILKRNKRTLVNFQDQFLIPFVEKAAWRFMQFDPENFPVQDWKFVPSSSLGMLAREVEQLQFINLLKTLGPDSAVTPILLQGILENSTLPNKEQLKTTLMQSMTPNPEQQQQEAQLQQMATQLQMQKAQADVAEVASKVEVNKSQAMRNMAEAASVPEETRAKVLTAISTNLPNEDDMIAAEFDRRVKVADLMLKEADMDQNKEIVELQMKKDMDTLTNK